MLDHRVYHHSGRLAEQAAAVHVFRQHLRERRYRVRRQVGGGVPQAAPISSGQC